MDDELYLMHYGTKRHSGRYPWGSGANPYQRPYRPASSNPFIDDKRSFYLAYRDMRSNGMSESDITKFMDETYFNGQGKFKSTQLRAWVTLGKEADMAANVSRATELKNTGMSTNAIGKEMGYPESTIRTWLEPGRKEKLDSTRNVAEAIKEQLERTPSQMLDIGKASEHALNCSKQKMDAAVKLLEEEGYKRHSIKVEQQGNLGNYTTLQVLTKDDIPWKEVYDNRDKIGLMDYFQSTDGGKTVYKKKPPKSISSDRVKIIYAEDGGKEADGCMLIRPGVKELELGNDQYMQVRIGVDGTHYLKGMAMYGKPEQFPKGIDIIFNTNKTKDVPMINKDDPDNQVLKKMKDDKDMPFGANTKQLYFTDSDGKEKQSCVEKVNSDEDWEIWSKSLASQFLGKQPNQLAKQQLGIAYDIKANEFETIKKINNPTIKKQLLMEFADECDSAATHMKAAPLSGQATHVILPLHKIKDNEIYAPNYKQGEEVILVRYPHTGPFESPRLKVNNKNAEGKEMLGNAKHAVGINSKVAEQLSGADFDGDTVIVIPVRGQNIKTEKPLDGLKDFDHQTQYKAYPGMPRVGVEDNFNCGMEMGKVSNLITDMTVAGAPPSDIVKAVKHSMVVIDAEKHNLNWKLSEQDNNIKYLKQKYQNGGGASTILSQATAPERIGKRKEVYGTYKMTEKERAAYDRGEKVYRSANDFYLQPKTSYSKMTDEQKQAFFEVKKRYNKELEAYKRIKDRDPDADIQKPTFPKEVMGIKIVEKERGIELKRMATVKDARELISDHNTIMENIYASYANNMKQLALDARKEARITGNMKRDPVAAKTYSKEVESIQGKVKRSQNNSPKERLAQAIADKKMSVYIRENDDLTKEQIKKKRNKVLAEARLQTGCNRERVTLDEKEIEAIQNGAISNALMVSIFNNGDQEKLKKAFTPISKRGMSSTQISRAKRMLKTGYTQAEVAEALGISVSTLLKNVDF